MREEFLHFIWRMKNFSALPLRSTEKDEIQIIRAGEHNTNAGPDFLNAQLIIGNTHWAGNVEIHVKASDWLQHGHSSDPAYDNVILHVVYENDIPAIRDIPVLELKNHISQPLIDYYASLETSVKWVACHDHLPQVTELIKNMWLERLVAERLEVKSSHIERLLATNNNDWAETCYQLMGRNFGFKVNADAFEELCQHLPMKLIAKHKNNLKQIEALLFGQAGLLDGNFEDDYPRELQKEYAFLSAKYRLKPMNKSKWKFLRLRPVNFPTMRIAQFASLLYKSEHLFSRFLHIKNIKDASALLQVVASYYWRSHYRFDTETAKPLSTAIGRSSIENLIINTVAPILFSYGHIKQLPLHKETALELLEAIKPEQNHITRSWAAVNMENNNASRSQALIHLKNSYCNDRRCLSCGIGAAILKHTNNS